jgi:SAM-dependent methyltransferase
MKNEISEHRKYVSLRMYIKRLKILYFRFFHILTFGYFKNFGLKRLFNELKLQLEDNETALDLGCGHGDNSNFLSRYFKKVFSIDIDPFVIKNTYIAGNIKSNIFYSVGNAINTHLKNSSVDFILCTEVVEHIANDRLLFNEVRRVLKRGGLAYFTTGYAPLNKNSLYYDSTWLGRFEHVRPGYTKRDIKEKTSKLFKIIWIKNTCSQYNRELFEISTKLPLFLRNILYPLFSILTYMLENLGKKEISYNIQFLLKKL